MGLSVDPGVNRMFSIAESGYFLVTDLNDTSDKFGGRCISSKNLASKSGLKAMIHDRQRNVLFIASGDGTVFVMNVLPTDPEMVAKVNTD